jgi:hypothetical protein
LEYAPLKIIRNNDSAMISINELLRQSLKTDFRGSQATHCSVRRVCQPHWHFQTSVAATTSFLIHVSDCC